MRPRFWQRQLHLLGIFSTAIGLLLPIGGLAGGTAARAAVPSLGPVPSICPSNPPPTALPHALGIAIGLRPVYAVGFTSGLSLHVGNPHQVTYGPHGWYRKLAWIVGPDYRQRVMLRGSALGGGAPLWFQVGDQPPSTGSVRNHNTQWQRA
jgi:hypothetical protein